MDRHIRNKGMEMFTMYERSCAEVRAGGMTFVIHGGISNKRWMKISCLKGKGMENMIFII
jgi:hypothetical protein